MKVVLVNKFAHVTGGADRHVLMLRHVLEERGHSVALLSTAGGDADFEVPVHVTHATRDSLSAARQAAAAASALWNRSAARQMARIIETIRPDVIHAHKLYPQISVAPIVLARRRRVPIVQTVHDYEFISANPLDHSGSYLDRLESRRSYRLLNEATFIVRRRVHVPAVDEWISVSDAVAQRYRERGLRPTVLPNFVDRATAVLSGARSGVAFVGRLTEEKGVRHVVGLARAAPDVPVSIAGWGSLEPEIRKAADEIPNLHFAGRIASDAVPQMLAHARVLVMPSLWEEPGAIGVLEAMAVGTPVVVYRKGGMAEYVRSAGAGLVVEPAIEELTAAVGALLGDDELWSECSARASEAVVSRHSPDAYVDALLEIYERAASRG